MPRLNEGELTLYGIDPSPPTIFVLGIFEKLKIKYIYYQPNLIFKEHKSPWYLKINPNGALPAMRDDDGFCQNEGVAMVKYIIESRNIKTDLYPYEDIEKCAKINEALEFVLEALRIPSFIVFARILAGPKLGGTQMPTKAVKDELIQNLTTGYEYLDKYLELNGPFFGSEVPTIADHYAFIWVMIPHGFNLCNIGGFKHLEAWYEKMRLIKEIEHFRLQYFATMRKIFCLIKVLPVIKCCTCCFCCFGCKCCK
jgi:glutathione S-transferase